MDIVEQVYETLQNTLAEDYCIPWVTPIFIPGHPCFEAYSNMHEAYARLRIRLGVTDEDADAEEMIDHLLEYGKLLAVEMFRYGMCYQQMQNAGKPGA